MREMNMFSGMRSLTTDVALQRMTECLDSFNSLDKETKRSLSFMYSVSALEALNTARRVLRSDGANEDAIALVDAYIVLFDGVDHTNNTQPFDTMADIVQVLRDVLRKVRR